MDQKTYAKIDNATAAFGPARLQELVALRRALLSAGIAIELIEDFVAEKNARQQREHEAARHRQALFERHAPRCPDCGQVMVLAAVNTGPRDQVGGPWQSQWFCRCGAANYSKETAAEILQAMGLAMPAARTNQRRRCNGKA